MPPRRRPARPTSRTRNPGARRPAQSALTAAERDLIRAEARVILAEQARGVWREKDWRAHHAAGHLVTLPHGRGRVEFVLTRNSRSVSVWAGDTHLGEFAIQATRRKVANPEHESPYQVGVRVGRNNAETALEMLADGTMALDDGETRADRVREYARIASIEESEDGAVFYDDPVMNGGRYEWEEFERGVDVGIERALDRAGPTRNPARPRRPSAKRPAARRAKKRRR